MGRLPSTTFSLLLYLAVSASALASEHAAKLTRFYGDVKVLTSPQKNVSGEGPHALFEGNYYRVLRAKTGMELGNQDVVQTGNSAKAKFVFVNGDQIVVGSNSAYRMSWGGDKNAGKSVLDLMFGKVRMMVTKGGPRSGMEMRTRTMAMGVRGTDFYVTANGKGGASEVTVMRGTVAVTPLLPQAKPVEVAAGFNATIPSVPADTKEAEAKKNVVAVTPVTPSTLLEIQKETKMAASKDKPEITPELQAQVEELEKKAAAATLADIKVSDPGLYEQVRNNPKILSDVENLNTISVKKILDEVKKGKPSEKALESEDDVYKKYFRVE